MKRTMEGSKLSSGQQGSPQTESPSRHGVSSTRAAAVIAIILLAFAGLFVFGYRRYQSRTREVESAAQSVEGALPQVSTEKVRRAAASTELVLPGNITPMTEAYIYARASGYVRQRLADIGDRVSKGQLLAEIEAPELDQQVQQARAALAQSQKQLDQAKADLGDARAKMELAEVTWNRYKVLVDHGAVSRQEGDQQMANFRSASAAISSVEARIGSADQNMQAIKSNLDRLLALQEFEKVRAPFRGVITVRNFDVGALISGTGASMGQSGGAPATGAQGGELFRIGQIDVLRVLIAVPETDTPGIRVGDAAVVLSQAFPDREFTGHITRSANAVDMTSRTMLTEIQLRNPDLILLPGMFVKVRMLRNRKQPPLLITGDSIITTAAGLRVAVLLDVEPQRQQRLAEDPIRAYPSNARRVHLQPIQVGRDYGQEVEVISGLQGWEYVVVNPGDQIEEGAVVLPVASARNQKQTGSQH
jgi:multidrug efflux pump subunit AcrA (membrane-fusion protein)